MTPLIIVGLIIIGATFGYLVLGEFMLGWLFRMGTIMIKPGARRGGRP